MFWLIEELREFFKTNTKLKLFLPKYEELMKDKKIFFKNEPINGTYVKEILHREDNFEIILITWGGKSEADKHCHPENGCLLTVLDGNLIEERYNCDGELFEYNFVNVGDFAYMHNSIGKHRVINPNNHNVYSLHIYSPSRYYDNC